MTGAETIVNDDRVIVKYVGVLDTKVAPEFGELLNEAVFPDLIISCLPGYER